MWLSRELLMENSSARIVKKANQDLGFGLVVRVSITWLFIVLVLMPKGLLACGGGGWRPPDEYYNSTNTTEAAQQLGPGQEDDKFDSNLTGITNVVERNIKTAGNGWVPSKETQKEWKIWYEIWKFRDKENADPNHPGVSHDDRGPGSGWPNSPDWAGLGLGNPGGAIPPWAFVPKNFGRPNICYLPPVKGQCTANVLRRKPGNVYGFNPYTDQCETYYWSGCGGTRNKFTSKVQCEKHCLVDPLPACASNFYSNFSDKDHLFFKELDKIPIINH